MTSPNVNNQYNYFAQPSSFGLGAQQPYGLNSGLGNADLSAYFGGYPSTRQDGFNGLSPLGFNAASSPIPQQSSASAQAATLPLNDGTALAKLQGIAGKLDAQSAGAADQKISVGDLESALNDNSGKYSADEKKVIQYLLDNTNGTRGKLDHLDGSDDGTFSIDSLNKTVVNPNAQPPDQAISNTDAIRNLKDFMDKNHIGKLSRENLSRLANDSNQDEQLRNAAKKILHNEELFKVADDGGDGGGYDGTIGEKDLSTALRKSDLDSIGGSSSSSGAAGSSAVPYSAPAYTPAPPVSTGNPNLDYYYNNVYNPLLSAQQTTRTALGAAGS